MREAQRIVRGYWLSLTITALAFFFTIFFWSLSQRLPFALCLSAVMVCTFQRGPTWGLALTLISAIFLALVYAFIPTWSAPEPASDYLVRMVMFLTIGLLASYMSQMCRRAMIAIDGLQEVISSTDQALILADKKSKVLYLNPVAEKWTEHKDVEAVGRPLDKTVSLLDEKTRKPAELPVARAIREGCPIEVGSGLMVVSEKGKETPVEGVLTATRDCDDETAGLALYLRDVEKQRRIEKELAETATKLEEALEAYHEAEDAGRKASAELRRLNAERSEQAAQTEQQLQALRSELERKLRQETESRERLEAVVLSLERSSDESGRQLAKKNEDVARLESALREARAALERQAAEHESARQNGEVPLRGEIADLRRQVADHLGARTGLEEALRRAHREHEQQRAHQNLLHGQEIDRLNSTCADLRRQVVEKEQLHEQLQQSIREAAANHEQNLDEHQRRHADAFDSLRLELSKREQSAAELKQAHDHLERVLHEHGDALAAFDAKGRATLWNPAIAEVTSLTAPEVVGQPIAEVLAVLGVSGGAQMVADTLAGKSSSVSVGPFAGDTRSLWECELRPLAGPGGSISGGMMTCRLMATPLLAPVPTRVDEPATATSESRPYRPPHRLGRLSQEDPANWLSFN
jgi:PAS domain S-box-containing protein